MIKKNVILPTLIVGALISANSSAYTQLSCNNGTPLKWNTNNIDMYTFKMNGADHSAVQYAVNRWNENPSNFQISLGTWPLPAAFDYLARSTGNGINEIYWVSSVNGDKSSGQALTRKNCSSGAILEADVIVSSSATRNVIASLNKDDLRRYNGSGRSLQALMIHELGHVLGLGHVNDFYNVMGDQYSHVHANGNSLRFYAGENASDGAVALYGRKSDENIQDISVSHWKFDPGTSSTAEYSSHERTQIFTSSGGNISFTNVDGEPRYRVRSGQTVQVEFSYENNGETTATVDSDFYLSTNNTISTVDRKIASFTGMNLGRNEAVYERARTITIPSGLSTGDTYSIGVIVDSNDAVTNEVTELNNRSYINIIIVD